MLVFISQTKFDIWKLFKMKRVKTWYVSSEVGTENVGVMFSLVGIFCGTNRIISLLEDNEWLMNNEGCSSILLMSLPIKQIFYLIKTRELLIFT